MSKTRHIVLSTAILLVEGAIAAYLALMAYMLSSWMLNDSVVFRMEPIDWWVNGGVRFLKWLAFAAIAAAVTYAVNRMVCKILRVDAPELPKRGALLVGLGIALAAFAGSLTFAISKPFM